MKLLSCDVTSGNVLERYVGYGMFKVLAKSDLYRRIFHGLR